MDIFASTAHRPYPLAEGPWIMWQEWDNLLFAHWKVSVETLRPYIPPPLALDTFGDSAWIGITPFNCMIAPRGGQLTPLRWQFYEINLRTYVTLDGHPGIWFFSLDASDKLSIEAARRFYKLPYHFAQIACSEHNGAFAFNSRRQSPDSAGFNVKYAPKGEIFTAQKGSLEYFLVERYCLYAIDDEGQICKAEIHHSPWGLQWAYADISLNTFGHGIGPQAPPAHLLFSAHQEVAVWPLAESGHMVESAIP
jgi:uncharacterized protein